MRDAAGFQRVGELGQLRLGRLPIVERRLQRRRDRVGIGAAR